MLSARSTGTGPPLRTNSSSEIPATYSMTMNCLSPSCRNAWTLATLGWLSLRVELRLLGEAFEEERVGSELVAQHLDRDLALEHHVFGP